jgi:gas vesicle protein
MSDYERFGDYQPSERSGLGLALTFLFIGMGVGALTALLFAPKSGKQMRRMLRRTYEDTVENINEQAESLYERGSDLAEAARSKVKPLREAFRK